MQFNLAEEIYFKSFLLLCSLPLSDKSFGKGLNDFDNNNDDDNNDDNNNDDDNSNNNY